jgi:hypothetical protein
MAQKARVRVSKATFATKSRRTYLLTGIDKAAQLSEEEPQLPALRLRLGRVVASPIRPVSLALRSTAFAAMQPADGPAPHGRPATR